MGDHCAIFAAKLGEHGFWRTAISVPVPRRIDPDPYLNQPARPKALYYANHLHIYRLGEMLAAINMGSVNLKPGEIRNPEAVMWSEGHLDDVSFHMDHAALGAVVRRAIFRGLNP
jgi:hypothetical protein